MKEDRTKGEPSLGAKVVGGLIAGPVLVVGILAVYAVCIKFGTWILSWGIS